MTSLSETSKKRVRKPSRIYRTCVQVDSHIERIATSLSLLASSKRQTHTQVRVKRLISTFLVVILVSYSVSPLFLRANTVVFYPTSCLGGWISPEKALGKPDADTAITAVNSAVLLGNTQAEMYCGSFEGDIPLGTIPQSAKLVMHWTTKSQADSAKEGEATTTLIIGTSFASSSQSILDTPGEVGFTATTSVSSEDSLEPVQASDATPIQEIPTTKEVPPEDEDALPILPHEETVPAASTVEPVSSTVFMSLASIIFTSVYAQEESAVSAAPADPVSPSTQEVAASVVTPQGDAPVAQEISSEEADVVSASVSEVTEPAEKSPEEVVTESGSQAEEKDLVVPAEEEDGTSHHETAPTSSEEATSSPENGAVPEAAQEDSVSHNPPFIELLYTFDGITWTSLARVAASDIVPDQAYTIPHEAGTTWKSLKSLQVKVRSLQTLDESPALYVDAVELQIEHTKKQASRINANQGSVDIEVDEETGNKILRYGDQVIKRFDGFSATLAVVQVAQRGDDPADEEDSLWLYDVEDNKRLLVASSTQVANDFPFAHKGDYLFWLSQDKKVIYVFDTIRNLYFSKDVPEYDASEGERPEIVFEDIPWKILIGSEALYFWSEATGEVFADGDADALPTFRREFQLDTVLSPEEKGVVGIPLKNE